jgi:metal transporter CNNM
MPLLNYVIIVFLLLLSALFSGLTLGLLSLDPFQLHRKVKLKNKYAKKVYPLRKQGNLLLVTLLLGNVAVNSALAIFLGSLTAGIIAGVVSTSLIVIFGEIIPQSIFSRHALRLGSKVTWLVWIFLYLLYPIGKPLAMGLDYFLGQELPTIYSKKELRLIMKEQHHLKKKSRKKSDVEEHEFHILERGLIFSNKQVKSVMTPRVNAFMLSKNSVLSQKLINNIHSSGHSRVPVYSGSREKIIGILFTKDLISISPNDGLRVSKLLRKEVHWVRDTDKLQDSLKLFKKKRVHIFMVRNKFKGFAGIITLEDVLEEIVGEIMDEYDKIQDMRKLQ